MGTQAERGRGIENPLKGERERMKKWQPYKGAWNSLLQGLCFFDTLYPSPLSPSLTLTLSPIWLRLFLTWELSLYARHDATEGKAARQNPAGVFFKSAFFSVNPTTIS